MDVHAKLAELRRIVEEARSMPMSASAVVNRAELLALIDELARRWSGFADSARGARRPRGRRREGRAEAAQIVGRGAATSGRRSSPTPTSSGGQARGRRTSWTSARAEAEELRAETDEYVDAKLANFEITLERTIEAVKRGRERLAGRPTSTG